MRPAHLPRWPRSVSFQLTIQAVESFPSETETGSFSLTQVSGVKGFTVFDPGGKRVLGKVSRKLQQER